MEAEIEELKQKFEKEIEKINQDFLTKFEKLTSIIKQDFIANQNDNFKYQNDITLLKRDKLELESRIEKLVPLLQRTEDTLYGREIFKLEPNDKTLDNIQNINLRAEHVLSMRNGEIIH